MTTRERHRRDAEILALSYAGVPARKIAAQFGIGKRQCNRIIAAGRQERQQPLRRSLARAQGPGAALELLDAMDEQYLRASRMARAGGRAGIVLSLAVERSIWDERRAALEKLIAETASSKEPTAPGQESSS
jgi:hypothetical protein